jgi:zinc protease
MSWTLEVEHPFGASLTIRRHRLANGLGLIALADPAAPIVTYQTWFGVGSRHEEVGRTGMAHLFEHLMFNQTKGLPAGEFDRRIDRTGGDSNAATWVDWTYYRDTVPADHLGMCVELEADRMANLVLEDGPLEAEREVVINERLQRVEDDVDGFVDEELFRLAFERHPYRWPTIGWMDDIRGLAKPDVHRFYRTFYAPNNACLVVVGRFDEAELLARIAAAYGHLPPAALPGDPAIVEPAQRGARAARFRKPTAAPRVTLAWRAPSQREPGWPALLFLSTILGAGSSSRLHRRLVIERELVSSIGCDVSPFRDPGLFRIAANLTRGSSVDEVVQEIDAALGAIADGAIAPAELDKVRNLVETDFWAELETCDGRAEALGHYQIVHGDFRAMFAVAERLATLDAAAIAAAVRVHLRPDARCQIVVEPDGSLGDDEAEA